MGMLEKFKGVDPWVSHLKFKDFAKWCIQESGCLDKLDLDNSDNEDVARAKSLNRLQSEHGIEMKSDGGHGVVVRHTDENQERVRMLFAEWDADMSGTISKEELKKVFLALDSKMTDKAIDQLFTAADGNKD